MIYKTTRPHMWDELAAEYLGSEFEISRLLRMQDVKNFSAPVYSFIVENGASIRIDETEETAADTFPAPCEA